MAGVLGVNCTVKWKTIDISPYLTTAKSTRTVKTKPSGTFGTMDETFVEAQRDVKLAMHYLFDKGASTPSKLFYDAAGLGAGAVEYYPESSAAAASNVKYAGNGILTKQEEDSGWDKLVEGNADIQVSGAWARTIVP